MSDIWHKLPEQPEKGRDVLEKWHHLGIHYTHFVAKNGIAEDNPFTDAWCYLDDLLALETELERTRKALDEARYFLKEIRSLFLFEKDNPARQNKWVDTAIRMWGLAEEALDEITALEQKDVK